MRGTWHPARPQHHVSDSPGREPASVILENASLLTHPTTPPAPACKLHVLPSFYLGRRGPAGRSEERPALPARPASCSPGCPGSWSRGNNQKSLEKHENINHTPRPQLRMGLEAKGSRRLCRF